MRRGARNVWRGILTAVGIAAACAGPVVAQESKWVKTGATGQADVSFTASDSGLYQFKVRNVSHPTRTYDVLLNIETTDTLVIP